MDYQTQQTLREQAQQIAALQRQLAQRPAWVVPGGGSGPYSAILIAGGQSPVPGQYALTYAASLTISQLYDPDTHDLDDYPAGLGAGWLMTDAGRSVSKVLVRYDDRPGGTEPLIAGSRRHVAGTTTLTVSGGPDDGETQVAYILRSWG